MLTTLRYNTQWVLRETLWVGLLFEQIFSLVDDRIEVTFLKKVVRNVLAIHLGRGQLLSLSFYHQKKREGTMHDDTRR
jgi:hypothetical protein